jgi:hypothetical protein
VPRCPAACGGARPGGPRAGAFTGGSIAPGASACGFGSSPAPAGGLKLAGRDEPPFADDAIARLHRVANGLPRALNNAAAAALIAAAAAGKDLVDDACAKKAVAELTRD